MDAEDAIGRDWSDAAAYAPLLEADRSLVAWEWLRRDPAYRAAADSSRAPPGRFGLVAFEAPDAGVPDARPIWSACAHPYVISARPSRACASARDSFDVGALAGLARIVADACREHLLLCDGFRSVRLDAPNGTFRSGAVELAFSMSGIMSAEAPLLALRRFLALAGSGRFARSLHPREVRGRRWVLMLRAWDAHRSGAGQREIAELLLSRTAGEPCWRSREPSIRSQAQRLVRCACSMAAGGYRALLR
ncbi:MAG TPA: DUF2285 domain-containing protein [Sphingomicrobium sp.]|nr:DUF2285 domain-containing protein [Sphingomicrobium sp.]